MNLFLISLGGALGALVRYFIAITFGTITSYGFPIGTLLANVVGCFLIGLLVGSGAGEQNENMRLGIGVGFLGALTTFSTFSAETLQQMLNGNWGVATINVVANLALCLIAVFAGVIVGRKIWG